MLILGIIASGMAIGALAQLLLGRASTGIDWTMALVAGIAGALVGGLLISLIAGDGLALRPSGFIGAVIGAIIVTAIWVRFDQARADEARTSARGPRR